MTPLENNKKISLYLFLEAFSFKLSEDNKYSWADELREIIPVSSYKENIERYEKLYRRRRVWEKGCEEFGFEKELSLFYITRCFMNAYGLGFLLIPIRYIATLIKISKIGAKKIPKDKKYLKHTPEYRSEYRDLKRELSRYNRPKLCIPNDESELQSIEKGFIKIDGESYFYRKIKKQELKRINAPGYEPAPIDAEPIIIKIHPKWRVSNIKFCPIKTAENKRKLHERGITYITTNRV